MKTSYDPNLKANITHDDAGRIRGILHLDEYREIERLRAREAAAAYLRDIAWKFGIAPDALRGLEQTVSYLDPHEKDVEYRFSEEKISPDLATYAYYQTFLNTPVWSAGVSVMLKPAPTRVVAATNTSEYGIDATLPPAQAIARYRRLFATACRGNAPPSQPGVVQSETPDSDASGLLGNILGSGARAPNGAGHDQPGLRLNRGRFFVYRYDPAKRTEDFPQALGTNAPENGASGPNVALTGPPPTLPLPPVPASIQPGHWYLVAELLFRLPYHNRAMNWRMLVEVETDAILYLRALTAGANGLVFVRDPITATGNPANSPAATNDTLSLRRSSVPLPGLTAPGPGRHQELTGNFVHISDFEPATAAPPTQAPGADFEYEARTDEFAAVNAYYHCDRFFRLVEDLGFPVSDYFDGTTFPIPVDHRGMDRSPDGIWREASCSADTESDGIGWVDFALADLTDTANPMGIAADWRVVLHELAGHGILYDHVNMENFGFAHSAGDSFAVILNDPDTLATDRFESYPWVNFIGRRHDRSVADGWGWGGTYDLGGYWSEQILATSHFRAYQAIGGDSASLGRRQFAARCMARLMLEAVKTLTPTSNPSTPDAFLRALLVADSAHWTSEGLFGGAYGKVLTWAFEKQNLNSGLPPIIDVYIDDGRAGEYPYLAVHFDTTTIWNRRSPDGMNDHQEPALESVNYAYVKIKNRGTAIADNVTVKAYHCKPSAGVLWPNDLQPMTTAQLSAGTLAPDNTEEKTVGPFEWTPVANAWGHDCMLMVVSTDGDPSNVDKFLTGEYIEDWRLVPNDNNVGQRNVTLVPGGGGARGLAAGLHGKGFWVSNPGRTAATIAISITLPPLLAQRGWRIGVRGLPDGGARMKAREQRLVTFEVHAGASFTKAEAAATAERDIVVTATADGALIGGMVYRIDPELEMPFNDCRADEKRDQCRARASELLTCLNLPGDNIKSVRVRKIAIDIEMGGDDDCCRP